MSEMKLTTRILIALAIAGALYGVSLGVGSLLYSTGVIATGATHADCGDHRDNAEEQNPGVDEDELQPYIKADAEACLAANELTDEEAFREEYLFWPIWPAVICAVIFLLWPAWSRILHNQETAEGFAGEASPHQH